MAMIAKNQLSMDPRIADTLGWVHYKQKQYYIAALEFQQAIDKSPITPLFHYHLALAFLGQNKNKEAINSVKQSLLLSDSFPDRDKAEALYKKLTGKNFK